MEFGLWRRLCVFEMVNRLSTEHSGRAEEGHGSPSIWSVGLWMSEGMGTHHGEIAVDDKKKAATERESHNGLGPFSAYSKLKRRFWSVLGLYTHTAVCIEERWVASPHFDAAVPPLLELLLQQWQCTTVGYM